MKKLFLFFLTIIFTSTIVRAQSPERMTYQAVVRNSNNQLVANQGIGIKIEIVKTKATGTAVYTETQATNTNANGLINIIIGVGTSNGNFADIKWDNDKYYIRTNIDPTTYGGTNYSITGAHQLLSVPYALYAKKAHETDPLFINSPAYRIQDSNIVQWTEELLKERDSSNVNELQLLSISEDTLFLSNGGYVILPSFSRKFSDLIELPENLDLDKTDDFDGSFSSLTNLPSKLDLDYTDDFDGRFTSLTNVPSDIMDGDDNTQLTEYQVDDYVDNNGYLTEELDADPTNEIQQLTIESDIIFLSDGGFVKLPASTYFSGSFNDLSNVPVTLDIDDTDDFDHIFSSLLEIPDGLIDGDDNTQLDEAAVDAFVANNNYVLTTNNLSDIGDASITRTNLGLEIGTDVQSYNENLSDLSDGTLSASKVEHGVLMIPTEGNANEVWTSDANGAGIWSSVSYLNLVDVPANIDIDKTDDFDGNYNSLTNKPTTITTTQANAIATNTTKNSYPTADAAKLGGIEANAQANVQSDWNATTGDALILNKPTTISPAQITAIADNSAKISYPSAASDKLATIATGAQVNVNANWNATTGDAQILNKPDFSGWDMNVADDFDGNYNSLSNIPTTITTSQASAISANTLKNSYPATDATKLANIEENAQANVQSDWNATTGDAQILNKPTTISTAQITAIADNSAKISYPSAASDKLATIATGAQVNVNANWNATTGDAQILNKPDVSGWDMNAADDFDGKYTSLSDIPENIDTDYTDDFDGNYNSLINKPTTITTEQADDIAANTLKNSYPSTDATKLANIEENAQANVQSDWSATTGDALILNKPTTISPAQTTAIADNSAKISYPSAASDKLATIATGAEVNVNADWNATSGDAQILNIPADIADGDDDTHLAESAVDAYVANNGYLTNIPDNSVAGTDIELGSDAEGDIMYYDGTDWIRLPKGNESDILKIESGVPVWKSSAYEIPVINISTNTTVSEADQMVIISGGIGVTLSSSPRTGQQLTLFTNDSSATISASHDVIHGASTYTTATNFTTYGSNMVKLVFSGSQWYSY